MYREISLVALYNYGTGVFMAPREGRPHLCYDENVNPVCDLMNWHYFKFSPRFYDGFIVVK